MTPAQRIKEKMGLKTAAVATMPTVMKGGHNPPNASTKRPPAPQGSNGDAGTVTHLCGHTSVLKSPGKLAKEQGRNCQSCRQIAEQATQEAARKRREEKARKKPMIRNWPRDCCMGCTFGKWNWALWHNDAALASGEAKTMAQAVFGCNVAWTKWKEAQ